MSMPEPLDLQRNLPRQERARQTVATLFEATAQLLERSDNAAVTTNHVAARAGFSIGTLYRYFSGKSALLKAMALHEMDSREAEIRSALAATEATSTREIVQLVVRPVLRPFSGRSAVRRALLKAALGIPGLAAEHEQMVTRVTGLLIETVLAKAEDCRGRPSPEAEYIMLRGAIGAIRSDVVFGGGRTGTAEFEDALVRMVCAGFDC